MAKELALSVVLATYCRAEILRETPHHLLDQDLDPAEYGVIDDGSTDHTRRVVEEWVTRAPFRLRYLHHANHGPGYTQNCRIGASEAPVVLLMADDIFRKCATTSSGLATCRPSASSSCAMGGSVTNAGAAVRRHTRT